MLNPSEYSVYNQMAGAVTSALYCGVTIGDKILLVHLMGVW